LLTPIGLLVLDLLLSGLLFLVFGRLAVPVLVPCSHPLVQPTLLAIASTLSLNILAGLVWGSPWWRRALMSFLTLSSLFLLALFLGSYIYSPLDFSKGNDAIFYGFLVSRRGRVNEVVPSGEIITLSAGAPVAISIDSDLQNLDCRWVSLNGGAWDDPASCDTTYMPPAADFDILTVRINPACRLPVVRGQIKISILP
jgi:hypothetical protein